MQYASINQPQMRVQATNPNPNFNLNPQSNTKKTIPLNSEHILIQDSNANLKDSTGFDFRRNKVKILPNNIFLGHALIIIEFKHVQ